MRESAFSLPIDSLIPAIKTSLQNNPNLVLEATPGAGKTTRVPPALLDPAISGGGEIWVLEPRRIAARLSAQRVAEELGEKLGETVGYQIRFEEISGPRTRLRFLTEGVLTRRLLSNPTLKGVSVVVLDEFHERHLQTDLALALLRQIQITKRPDLKLVVMSATLDVTPISAYLGDCPTLLSEGRQFDISIEHLKQEDSRPLSEQVASALNKLIARKLDGNVLVFLPGASEIRRAQEACAKIAAKEDFLVTLLHGELSTGEQDRAIRPTEKRKVILSTNVAETSITIDGVVAVIDSGQARIAEHSPWSGLPTLPIRRISKAGAAQRAGRAGRTQAGTCLRLFTEMDFALRSDFETPEIRRLDLIGPALELHAAGIRDLTTFEWFDMPDIQSIEAAESLLQKLGAINCNHELTSIGNIMLRYPLHPRQSRLLIEARSQGIAARGALIAVLINEGDLRSRNFSPSQKSERHTTGDSDLIEREELFKQARAVNFESTRLLELGINPGAARSIDRSYKQLLRFLQYPETDNDQQDESSEERIRFALLAGYPDRIVKRQESDNASAVNAQQMPRAIFKMSNGTLAQLSPESIVRESEFLIAIDATEKTSNRTFATEIRTAVAIHPDWLLDLFSEGVCEKNLVDWQDSRERVQVVSLLQYDQLILDKRELDSKLIPFELEKEIAQTLFVAVKKCGWQHFFSSDDVARLQSRLEFAQRVFSEIDWPNFDSNEIFRVLELACTGKRSFAELRSALNFDSILHEILGYERLTLLNQIAPEKIHLSRRKNIRVNYEYGQAPWIASRLQDFFGMDSVPTIASGRASLVLHLLAPNQRPVQITQDLAGFWTRHYPQIRRELARRYPKHSWPENPT